VLGASAATGSEPASALDGTARLLADLAARGALLGAASADSPEILRPDPESSTMAENARREGTS
jgi:hypothetical protein